MNQQLEMIQRALDMGAMVSISFHSSDNEDKLEAEMKAYTIADGLGLHVVNHTERNTGFYMTDIVRQPSNITVTSYYKVKQHETS
jgi:hypothetical protein